MLLERMATWTRDKLAEFFEFITIKLENMAPWIGKRVTELLQYLTAQWQKLAAWVTEVRAIFKDPATAFTVVKELTFGAVINAADVGTDIYTALSHYQLLMASDQVK